MAPMRLPTLLPALALVLLVAAGPAAAATGSRTETGSSGDVTATLSYDYKTSRYGVSDFSNARVTITRAGVELVDAALGKECRYCTPWPASGAQNGVSSVTARDLDSDGEPEVLVDLYTGGANCCFYTNSYRYDANQNKYILKVLRPGLSFPYTLGDLDGNGAPEFKSVDYRFAYKYGSNADTPRPLRIFQWNAGKLLDVTIAFPKLAAADAGVMYRGYLHFRKVKGANVRGLLAAYLADSYNARNGRAAWRRVVAAYRRGEVDRKARGDVGPFGQAYLQSLRRFLTKLGYLRAA
jgi:hypothetical protein